MEIVRLEYNQKQGLFHFENVDKDNKNTNGWETICDKISVDQAMEFVEDIDKEIPTLGVAVLPDNTVSPTFKPSGAIIYLFSPSA